MIRDSTYEGRGIIPGTKMLWKIVGKSPDSDQDVCVSLLPVLRRYVGGADGN